MTITNDFVILCLCKDAKGNFLDVEMTKKKNFWVVAVFFYICCKERKGGQVLWPCWAGRLSHCLKKKKTDGIY